MTDPFSFRPPKGSLAVRKAILAQMDLGTIAGIKEIVDDPRLKDTVYVIGTREAKNEIQARGTKIAGVEHTGAMRRFQLRQQTEAPVCAKCNQPHWPYQLCE